jgi:hypothetical protein
MEDDTVVAWLLTPKPHSTASFTNSRVVAEVTNDAFIYFRHFSGIERTKARMNFFPPQQQARTTNTTALNSTQHDQQTITGRWHESAWWHNLINISHT